VVLEVQRISDSNQLKLRLNKKTKEYVSILSSYEGYNLI